MKKGFLGIEITSSRLRYLLAVKHKGQIEISKAGTVPFKMGTEAEQEIAEKIHAFIEQEHMNPERVFLTISRQDTLIRSVKVPKMGQSELEEVIKAEIEKIPAFFDNRFDFIFQKFHFLTNKIMVVFAAINQNVLTSFLKGLQKINIPFLHIEIAPLNLPRVLWPYKEKKDNQVILVVNDLVSYFIIMKDHQYRLFYKTTIGIDNLYPEKNDQVNGQVLNNLTSELQRVLKSYLTENKNEMIMNLSLIWDEKGAAGFDQHIQHKLGLKIDVHRLSHMSMPEEAIKEEVNNPIYTVCFVPMFHCLNHVKENFAFDHFFRAFHLKRYILKGALAAMIFLAVVGLGLGSKALSFHTQKLALKRQTFQVSQEIKTLKANSTELFQKRDDYLITRKGLLDQASYVKELNRISWSQVLAVIADEMPENLALTSFKFSDAGSVDFKGDGLAIETISEMIRSVDDSSILESGRFDFLKEKMIEDQKLFQFGIMAQLQKPDINEPEKTGQEALAKESAGSHE